MCDLLGRSRPHHTTPYRDRYVQIRVSTLRIVSSACTPVTHLCPWSQSLHHGCALTTVLCDCAYNALAHRLHCGLWESPNEQALKLPDTCFQNALSPTSTGTTRPLQARLLLTQPSSSSHMQAQPIGCALALMAPSLVESAWINGTSTSVYVDAYPNLKKLSRKHALVHPR